MLKTVNVSQARANFRDIFHTAVRSHQPVVISRGDSREETMVVLAQEDLKRMLAAFLFQLKTSYDEKNQVWVADLGDTAGDGLGHLWATGETKEEALNELVHDLIDYAKEYFDRADLFLRAPNRAHHAPWLLRVLFCENDGEVASLVAQAQDA